MLASLASRRTDALIVLVALIMSFECMGAPVGQKACFRTDRVDFSESHGRIRIVGEPEKKESVDVLVEVDCDSGSVMVPQSAGELVDRLDRALPADYKIAIEPRAARRVIRVRSTHSTRWFPSAAGRGGLGTGQEGATC